MLQLPITELPGRTVDAIGDQDLIATSQKMQQHAGDCGQPGGKEHAAGSAIQIVECFRQRFMCRRPEPAIVKLLEGPCAGLTQVLQIVEQHC